MRSTHEAVNTTVAAGSGALKSSLCLLKTFLLCCFGNSLFVVYFPLFFCCLIIPLLQGVQIPSRSCVIFIEWRPIYKGNLKMWRPEIKHSPNHPNPGVLYLCKTVKGTKNCEPGAKSHFQLHNYRWEMAFQNHRCGTEVGGGQRCDYTG